MNDIPESSGFLSRPSTSGGRWAGWAILVSVASLLIANVFFMDKDGSPEYVRVSLVFVFSVAGICAFVLGVRAVRDNDRNFVVWVATILGLIATLLTVAEFTILE